MVDYLATHFPVKPVRWHQTAASSTARGEAAYKRACLTCHEDDLVEQQRLTRDGWTREVDKMIRWGAAVPEADKDALVGFLAARHPMR